MGSSSKNLKQSFLPPGALTCGRGQSLKSMGSVRVTAEKRTLIDPTNRMLETLRSKSEKEIGLNFTSMGSVKGSIVVQGTSIGKSKGCSVAYSDRNELASGKNLMQPCLDLIEDETSFPHENLDEMQEARMPNGKSKNYSIPAFGKNEPAHNKNIMQPGFDPIEVDTLISFHDLEVMGRGKGFTYLNSIGGSIEMIGNNKEKDIRQNFTSIGSAKRSIVVKGTSIGKSKGCSAAHSDRNEIASDKNLVFFRDQIQWKMILPSLEMKLNKDLKGGRVAKTALLEELNASRKEKVALLEELNASRKENESMKRRLDNIEKKCEMFESVICRDPSSPPSSSE
ncbi:hypothetical protein H5410_021423 [Solanum commersonii]|uniref:Uncharacterized protein n=1 Tax=Solanum commersonii TaxID=4109 RepID=A0A9J5ZH60_SOLCO|nr:hypothetical protein H5410_021423 [Solanum commersonii]